MNKDSDHNETKSCGQDIRKNSTLSSIKENGHKISVLSVVNIQDNVVFFKPPDGGYGWVIVGLSFVLLLLSEGLIYSFGTFYEDIETVFMCTSRTPAVLIGAMFVGFSGVCGPIVAGFCNKFGFKPVVLVSGIVISAIFLGSAFAHTIELFMVLLGVFGGITFSGIILPGYSIFSQWFDKNSSLACSLVYGGAGTGCMIFPYLIDYLIMNYTMRGCLIIISAIYLNFIPLALLIKDPMNIVQDKVDQEVFLSDNDVSKMVHSNDRFSKLGIMSNSSLFRSDDRHSVNYRSTGYIKNSSSRNNLSKSQNTVYSTNVGIIPTITADDQLSSETEIPCIEQNAYAELINKTLRSGSHLNIQSVTESNLIASLASIRSNASNIEYYRIKKAISKEFARPFVRNNINPTIVDSSPHIPTSKTEIAFSQKDIDQTEPPETLIITKKEISNPIVSVLGKIFQKELLKLPSFNLITTLSFASCCATLSVPQTMKNFAIYIDMTRVQFSYFVAIYGFGLLTSKPIFGFIMKKVKQWELLYLIAALTMVLSTLVMGYIARMEYVVFYGLIFSYSSSCVLNLRSLLITRYMPKKFVTSGFGWAFFTSGLSMCLAPFIALIGSKYQMFNLSFGVYSLCLLIGGLMGISLLCTKRPDE